jgi:hypothetical protein
MSPVGFLAAAVAISGIAVSAGCALYQRHRDALEDLRDSLEGLPKRVQRRPGAPHRETSPTRARLSAVAVAAVVLAAVAVLAHGVVSNGKTGSTASAKPNALPSTLGGLLYPPRAASIRHAPAQVHRRPTTRVARSVERSAPEVQSTSVPDSTFVSDTVQKVVAHTAPPVHTTSGAVTPHVSGPAPLQAPTKPSVPTPIKAP